MCFHGISIHTNFHQNWIINKCARMKNLCLYNADILEKFEKDWALNKKYIVEKDYFEILRWPFVTFNDLWGHNWYYNKIASLYC